MEGTFLALVPPILAIIVSLITKEVNISLLAGIVIGALIYCGLNPFSTVTTIFDVLCARVYSNMGVLIFIVLLGMIVYLMNLSGATHEYEEDFEYPRIDESKCVRCYQCIKVCPIKAAQAQ